MIYLYLFGTCFHFIYVFMIIVKIWGVLPDCVLYYAKKYVYARMST